MELEKEFKMICESTEMILFLDDNLNNYKWEL